MSRLLLLGLVLLLGACAQSPVSIDYDPSAYLRGLKTYAITPPGQGGAQNIQSLDNSRIEAALRGVLNSRSYKEVAADKADFWVNFRVQPQHRIQESGVSYGFGFGTGNVGVGVSTGPKAKEIVEGQLVVELVDPAKKQVIWSAKANRLLKDSMSPMERDNLINSLVAAMFERFPPD